MKKLVFVCVMVAFLAFGLYFVASGSQEEWSGVDETVIEKAAIAANRPPKDPLINTDKGDLLLFLFLTAGAAGGFLGGYCFRGLFPTKA